MASTLPPTAASMVCILACIALSAAIFGYVGMISGIGLTELINYGMQASGAGEAAGQDDISMFRDPTVSLTIALISTGVLILAGVLAGYFPARKAVKITAIEAMRAE